ILVISLKTPADIATNPAQYLPLRSTLQNYISLFGKSSYRQNVLSSVVVATAATLIFNVVN
ncbi:carbohydrate ABC transporter permease, partial [Brachybacterium sp. AOP29-B2-41]